MKTTIDKNYKKAQEYYLIGQIFSYKTLFFNTITTISYAFLPAMNKGLHATLIKMVSVEVTHHFSVSPPTSSLCSHSQELSLHKPSASNNKCQWILFFFFLHGRIQWHAFASSALPCQTLCCQMSSAAISCRGTKRNGILTGWFNLYSHTTNIQFWFNQPTE